MSSKIRNLPLFLLAVGVLTLAACGGSAAAKPASDNGPTGSTGAISTTGTMSATPEEIAEAVLADAADDAAAGASDIVVTGAIEIQSKKAGSCGMNPLLDGHFEFGFDNTADGFEFYGDDLWLIEGTIRGYEGPGTFETAEDAHGKARVRVTDMMGRSFDVPADGGTFTLDEGELSGSLDVTLTDEDAGETITVSGTFTCEPL